MSALPEEMAPLALTELVPSAWWELVQLAWLEPSHLTRRLPAASAHYTSGNYLARSKDDRIEDICTA